MKKRNLLLVSLLSLCLAACGGKESETSTPTEPVVSDTQPGGDKTETLPPVSDETDTEKETTTEPDIYDTLWSSELVDLMVAHLNGNVIPYIDLGKGVTGAYFLKSTVERSMLLSQMNSSSPIKIKDGSLKSNLPR